MMIRLMLAMTVYNVFTSCIKALRLSATGSIVLGALRVWTHCFCVPYIYILCVCIVSSVCHALSLNNIFSRDRCLTICVQLGRSLGINKPYNDYIYVHLGLTTETGIGT